MDVNGFNILDGMLIVNILRLVVINYNYLNVLLNVRFALPNETEIIAPDNSMYCNKLEHPSGVL